MDYICERLYHIVKVNIIAEAFSRKVIPKGKSTRSSKIEVISTKVGKIKEAQTRALEEVDKK